MSFATVSGWMGKRGGDGIYGEGKSEAAKNIDVGEQEEEGGGEEEGKCFSRLLLLRQPCLKI